MRPPQSNVQTGHKAQVLLSQAIEDMCREQLGQALRVYSQEVPLAQARDINGLRAVFGEVRIAPPASACRVLKLQQTKHTMCRGSVANHKFGSLNQNHSHLWPTWGHASDLHLLIAYLLAGWLLWCRDDVVEDDDRTGQLHPVGLPPLTQPSPPAHAGVPGPGACGVDRPLGGRPAEGPGSAQQRGLQRRVLRRHAPGRHLRHAGCWHPPSHSCPLLSCPALLCF